MEKITDQDFKDLMIISATIKKQKGVYSFAPVNSLYSKTKAASEFVPYFMVSDKQEVIGSNSSKGIEIIKISGLSPLIDFIYSWSHVGKAFRKKIKHIHEALYPKDLYPNGYPEPCLTGLPKTLNPMSPMEWNLLLNKAQTDNSQTHLALEYLMQPISSAEQSHRLVVFGEMKNEKTDFLRFVGATCDKYHRFVPVYIDLSVNDSDEFINILKYCIEPELKKIEEDSNIKCDFDSLLNRKDLLLLLDGLESIKPKSRLYNSLSEFCRVYERCHILLSCDKDCGYKYLDLIGDYQLSLLNGLSVIDQQKFAKESLDEDQQVLFNSLRQDDEILRLCANPSFLLLLRKAILECNEPKDLLTKWDQLDYLFSFVLKDHDHDEAALCDELINLAARRLKSSFSDHFSSRKRFKKPDKVLQKKLFEVNILVRDSNSQEGEYQFRSPTFFAYFAAKFLLQNRKICERLFFSSNSDELLSLFANDPSLRELFLFLFLNGKIPIDWVRDLLDPVEDDIFFHRITLGIKLLSQKRDHFPADSEILTRFDDSIKLILEIWRDAKYSFESDHLWTVIKDIAFSKPDLITNTILPPADVPIKIESDEMITKIANLSVIKTDTIDDYLDRNVTSTRYILNLLKNLTFNLGSLTQEKILNLFDKPEFELEVLALLGKTKLDFDKRNEALNLLKPMIQNPGENLKQTNRVIREQELRLTCAALANLELDINNAEKVINNLLKPTESENINQKQYEPFNRTWIAIELAQHYDLKQFTNQCRENILSELGKLSDKYMYLEYSRQVAAKMFEKTKDYDIRKALASIIWAKSIESVNLSEILNYLPLPKNTLERLIPKNIEIVIDDDESLHKLFDALYTRVDTEAEFIDGVLICILAGSNKIQVTKITIQLLEYLLSGRLIKKERLVNILLEAPIKSVDSKVVKQLQDYIENDLGLTTDLSHDVLRLYGKFSSFKKNDNPDLLFKILEDKIYLSDSSKTDIIKSAKDIIFNQLQFMREEEEKLLNLIKAIANNCNTSLVNDPFFCQLDKAGFRFYTENENGQEKINVTYRRFYRKS